ncbi:hypothetical protein BESB_052530 [Besnoitia besnoiti]|uniref:Transmembrane protein n=1 Tax=Besnoitia besnoiti TaxID=94643 RepID=A0A2A9MJN6_BESBE|nr:hypothetical protein BESB_052530 [Besnoitia besnoiti]PFH35602.1 hypothetical protein BESB_052530 [Besnoitia besnoiti]
MDPTYSSRARGSFGHGFSLPLSHTSSIFSRDHVECETSVDLLEAGEASCGGARARKPGYFYQSESNAAGYVMDDSYSARKETGYREGPAGVFEQIRQATRVWLTLAACLLLLFVAGSTLSHWTSNSSTVTEPRTAIQDIPSVNNGFSHSSPHRQIPPSAHSHWGGHDDSHAALHAALGRRVYIHQETPSYARHERADFEADIMKQHPDDHSFVDVWDGEEHHDLHLSRGIDGLQTPLYRLPFVEGQHNETHVVGVHTSPLEVPKRLFVAGGPRLGSWIGGSYDMMVTRDGRPKPLLVHGRLVWKREVKTEAARGTDASASKSMYLFYDHTHHTWVFNGDMNFKRPAPLAFLPHGALLPVVRQKQLAHPSDFEGGDAEKRDEKRYTAYLKHGVPRSVHWVVREPIPEASNVTNGGVAAEAGPTVDASIRVIGHPEHTAPEDFFELSLQKVFHSPEDDVGDEEESSEDDEYLEDEDDLDHHGIHGEYEDEDEEGLERLFVPEGTRTRQQYLTHSQTHVYHTFDEMHSHFDHKGITEDPIAYLESYGHPDVDTLERQFGDDTTAVPHPLRQPGLKNV